MYLEDDEFKNDRNQLRVIKVDSNVKIEVMLKPPYLNRNSEKNSLKISVFELCAEAISYDIYDERRSSQPWINSVLASVADVELKSSIFTCERQNVFTVASFWIKLNFSKLDTWNQSEKQLEKRLFIFQVQIPNDDPKKRHDSIVYQQWFPFKLTMLPKANACCRYAMDHLKEYSE